LKNAIKLSAKWSEKQISTILLKNGGDETSPILFFVDFATRVKMWRILCIPKILEAKVAIVTPHKKANSGSMEKQYLALKKAKKARS